LAANKFNHLAAITIIPALPPVGSRPIGLAPRASNARRTDWYEKRGVSMPRYFFTIHGQDRVADDPEGTYLPDAAVALSYAEYTI
jgi:hypothetical protein